MAEATSRPVNTLSLPSSPHCLQETAKDNQVQVVHQVTNVPGTSTNPQEYLDYAPQPFVKTSHCYRTFLDRLGFKEEANKVSLANRHYFEKDVRDYLCVPLTQFLRKEDNPAAFTSLIQGFLKLYGRKYWGDNNRDHLAVADPSKGFLYPRDAERENSKFLAVMEEFFNHKAKTHRHNDRHRPEKGKEQVLPTLDFTSINPAEVDMLRKQNTGVSLEGAFKEISKMPEKTENLSSEDAAGTDSDQLLLPLDKKRKVTHDRVTRAATRRTSETSTSKEDGITATAEPKLVTEPATEPAAKRTRRNPGPKRAAFPPPRPPRSPHKELRRLYKKNRRAERAAGLSPQNIQTPQRLPNGRFISAPSMSAPLTNNRHQTNTEKNDITELANGPPSTPNHTWVTARTQPQATRNLLQAPFSSENNAKPQIKAEPLSNEITSQTLLLVTATNQQDMAPVKVKLDCFKISESFFEFLAKECELGSMARKVTAISATYGWNGGKHRFRRDRLDVDWAAFCEELREAFEERNGFGTGGCRVEMLLHVVVV